MMGLCGSAITNKYGYGPVCSAEPRVSVCFPCVAGNTYYVCAGDLYGRASGTLVIRAFAVSSSGPSNFAPTNILLDCSIMEENLPVGTHVCYLTTQDPDADNTFVYTLVSGTGSEDNGSFNISRTFDSGDFRVRGRSSWVSRPCRPGAVTAELAAINIRIRFRRFRTCSFRHQYGHPLNVSSRNIRSYSPATVGFTPYRAISQPLNSTDSL